jgi:hypothetical protein
MFLFILAKSQNSATDVFNFLLIPQIGTQKAPEKPIKSN